MDNHSIILYNTSTNGKHIRISTKWVITIIVCLFLTLFFAINFLIPYGCVEVTGNEVDNDYNNFLAGGSLVRSGSYLYYSYNVTENKSGIIQIGQNGSKRIYWEGPYLIAPYQYAYKMRKHNDIILLGAEEIKCLDGETRKFTLFSSDKFPENMNLNFYICNDLMVYGSDSPEGQDLTVLKDEVLMKVQTVGNFCVTDTNVYYWEFDSAKDVSILHSINLFDREDSIIYSTTQYFNIEFFFVEGQYLIFEGIGQLDKKGYVCKIELNNFNNIEKVLYSHSSKGLISQINVYKDIVYVSTNEGLITIDLSTEKVEKISEKCVMECYILDDTWVYFVGKNGTLWRVKQDGQDLEKVYGW